MDRKIPFVKPARVGNYKIWRTKTTLGKGKDKYDVEQICVSDLEGLWQVRIPATHEIFAVISELYADETKTDALKAFMSNWFYVTSVANGYFQRAVQMCAGVFFNPDLLRKKKERKDLDKEVGKLVKDFLAWREVAEAQMKSDAPTEQEQRNDEVLEEMLEAIGDQ